MVGLRADRSAEDRGCHSQAAAVVEVVRKVWVSRSAELLVEAVDVVDFAARMVAVVHIPEQMVDLGEGSLPAVFVVGRYMEPAVAEEDTSDGTTVEA